MKIILIQTNIGVTAMTNRIRMSAHLTSILFVASVFILSPRGFAQSWAPQEANAITHLSSVDFVDAETGYAAGAFGVILKTTNGGASWELLNSGTGLSFSDIHFVSGNSNVVMDNIGWAVGENGAIFKTEDGGTVWTQQASGTSSWLNCVYFCDANVGWVGGSNGVILKTTNGGTTWSPVESGTTSTIENGCFMNPSVGYLVAQSGAVLKSVNAGSSWNLMPANTPTQLNAVCFTSPMIGWVAGQGGKIAKTVDGGASWVDQPSGTTRNLNSIEFANPDTGWAVGDNGTIQMTSNGGATWSNQISTTTNNIRSVYFSDPQHGWAVGLNSTILEYAVVHALPVQLASFSASVVGASVRLNWMTISEVNNFGFYVERSLNSSSGFERLPNSFVAGNGTTNVPRTYSFIDQNPLGGNTFYRLQQIDLDGTIHYTEPVLVHGVTGVGNEGTPVAFALKQNYPNPFNPTTTIEFSVPTASFVSLKVYDMLGQEVAVIVGEELSRGTYAKTFIGDGLASGVYLYKLSAGSLSATRRFTLSK
jgi:photosystem II stability/assembly factor-like uncharacterized protein